MSTAGSPELLASLLQHLAGKHPPASVTPRPAPEGVDPLTHLLVYSYLLWESRPTAAAASLARLYQRMVDYNELRVCLAGEIVSSLGLEGPFAHERASRLRATLNDIYRRHHEVSLANVGLTGKRDVRDYLESLDGTPRFVAARVTLLGHEGHAFPVDESLRTLLVEQRVIDPDASVDEAAAWIERHIRAGEARSACLLMESWRDVALEGSQKKAGAKRGAAARSPARPGKPRTRQAKPKNKDAKPATRRRKSS